VKFEIDGGKRMSEMECISSQVLKELFCVNFTMPLITLNCN